MRILLAIAVCFALAGCQTGAVTPGHVEPQTAAYSGNEANSGIVGPVYDGATKKFLGWQVETYWIEGHARRIAQYGDQIKPPLIDPMKGITKDADGDYIATQEALGADLQCARKERRGDPPTSGWEKLIKKLF